VTVGLVIVSHSHKLAEGVVELAAQMAPEVRVAAVGGAPGGGVGTDYDAVVTTLSNMDTGSGVVLLYDLGSAQMVAELAVESLNDPSTAVIATAPLVEGAVAAAVAAQGGGDPHAVARAAETAATPEQEQTVAAAETEELSEDLELHNEVGLHARPAALVARSVASLEASVTIALGDKTADAASVLSVMGLGARKGDRITIRASGPDAAKAIQRLTDLADGDFETDADA
jgi:PTS hybrid protein